MEELVDIHKLKKLEERYPFNLEELEILVLCHEKLQNPKDRDGDDFLLKLAHASPYTFFFLPGDELKKRVNWIEDHVLPAGFASQLRSAVSVDTFVEYANQGEDKPLERFLEGIADTGRRGSKEALRVMFRLLDQPEPEELMDICVRLVVASEALVTPTLDESATLMKLECLIPAVQAMSQSLKKACDNKGLDERIFVNWAEENFPTLSAPLSTFVHGLLFHGRAFPKNRVPFELPNLDTKSNIFRSLDELPQLFVLSLTSQHFGGKWQRLYSSFMDGRSFNRMEWSLLGYSGPTVILVKTTSQAVLGAFASASWKDSTQFYGDAECFLFELQPNVNIYRTEGKGENFMYLHSKHGHADPALMDGRPFGLGFGGTIENPRFFIPESFDHCSAHYLDSTFHQGELLPLESLEKFEIQVLEVWGVGGDEVITKALRDRAVYRERYDNLILRARMVQDKSAFTEDLLSGLIPNSLFSHLNDTRGRHDFRVDDEHGGYKVDH